MSIKCFFWYLACSREVEQAMVVVGEKMLLLLQSVSRVGTCNCSLFRHLGRNMSSHSFSVVSYHDFMQT